ncbi:MAG: hypothetical protein ACREH8_15900 [Opitutaceae bacterium]
MIQIRYYLDRDSRPLADSRLLNQPVTFIDPVTGVIKTINPKFIVANQQGSSNIDTSDFKYVLGAVNAKFFKDRLVVLGGVRQDQFHFRTRITRHLGDYPLDWDGAKRIVRPDAPPDYLSLQYQPVNAQGVPTGPVQDAIIRPRIAATGDRDPRYLNNRFQDDYNPPPPKGGQLTRSAGTVVHVLPWLSLTYNFAETFNPPTSVQRINSQSFPPTVAVGKDYGVRLELFKRRLNLGLNHFVAKEVNTQDGARPPDFNILYDANAVGDLSATGQNIRDAQPVPRSQWLDVRSRLSEGNEIELVFNATRGLRLMANFARNQTGAGNRYPDTLPYIEKNAALLKQILLDAGGLVDAANVATVDQSIPANIRSPDVQAAVNVYNALFEFQKTWTGRADEIDDVPQSGNFFADYTFHEGFLRRVRVGAGVKWRDKRQLGNRANDTIVNPNFNAALPVNATTNPLAIDDPAVDGNTPVFAPAYSTVTATLAYSWKYRERDFQANLVVNNVLNDRGPLYARTALRPRGGDFTSAARERIPAGDFDLKKPISFSLSLTVKL